MRMRIGEGKNQARVNPQEAAAFGLEAERRRSVLEEPTGAVDGLEAGGHPQGQCAKAVMIDFQGQPGSSPPH